MLSRLTQNCPAITWRTHFTSSDGEVALGIIPRAPRANASRKWRALESDATTTMCIGDLPGCEPLQHFEPADTLQRHVEQQKVRPEPMNQLDRLSCHHSHLRPPLSPGSAAKSTRSPSANSGCASATTIRILPGLKCLLMDRTKRFQRLP